MSRMFLAVFLIPVAFLPAAFPQDGKDAPNKTAAPDDDYRQFFKKPQTVADYWTAIQFEIEVGRFDLAGAHLRGLMTLKPSQDDLFKLGNSVGMAPILQLRNIRPWAPVPSFNEKPYLDDIARMEKAREDVEKIGKVRKELEKRRQAYESAIAFNQQATKDVDDLIVGVSAAIRKSLSDPDRIKKYVKNLTVGPDEKDFALKELYRSGAAVTPYLIDEWRNANSADRPVIFEAMRRLGPDILPALAAALDSDDAELKIDIIDIFRQRAAQEQAPHLWFLAASEAQPARARAKATEVLAYFLDTQASRLPPAKTALTREADRYYRHQVSFADSKAVTVWQWNGRNVVASIMPATKAEEYYGLRFARQALTLDPSYRPAQVVLISLALEKGYEQAGVAQPIAATNPAVHELLATVNPDLITAVLERALADKRFRVILGAVRALGEFAESRASRPSGRGEPVLVRALNYPDRRIQMAAAEAILRSPAGPAAQASSRVVDVLRRVVASDGPAAKTAGKVLVGFFDAGQLEQVAATVAKAGFEAVKVRTGQEAMRRLQDAADIDLLLLDAALPDPGLASLLGNLRADQNAGRLPVLLSATIEREDALRRYAQHFAHVTVIPFALATDAKDLEIALKAKIADPSAAPLSESEAKEYAERAIRYLGRMARGELAGYDARPASDAILNAAASMLLSPEGQIASFEAAGALAGSRPQTVLAGAILDQRRTPPLRVAAADLLIRNIQKNGKLLTRPQVQALEGAYTQPTLDPAVKERLAVLLGTLRPDARVTGERIRTFRPAPQQTPPPPPVPKKEAK